MHREKSFSCGTSPGSYTAGSQAWQPTNPKLCFPFSKAPTRKLPRWPLHGAPMAPYDSNTLEFRSENRLSLVGSCAWIQSTPPDIPRIPCPLPHTPCRVFRAHFGRCCRDFFDKPPEINAREGHIGSHPLKCLC